MKERTKFHVGLDVHKDSISVSAAELGRAPARLIGKVTHDLNKLLKVLAKIGSAEQLHIVYEAGPTGFGLQRALKERGYLCEIIAPSQIPRRPGDRVKTDGRDCIQLAECSRAGQLSAVWIPEPGDEAIRDLARAREDAVNSRVQARHQLKGFLLRHDIRYPGKTSWSIAYYRWLSTLNFDAGATQTAFTEYWHTVEAADERVERLTKAPVASITGWRFEPVVRALQALRGVAAITAISLMAEIGDLARFSHPRKLMGYLGLVPSEHSSGERTSRGSITKTGNAHARRLLTESAWNYRFKARIGREALARQEALPESIRTTAWKAQLRLTQRFAALRNRGVQINKACVAVARELAGFIWAIGLQVRREEEQAA
ncbi:IS110 family transposase [Variovorax ginsengisoli]|uniref:IS110 family transposase n=1 Tax=Variovorax ginsengisoli TaxID=363844 RepID=A0ABT8S1R2_9BURK|nr:IS110 family transposase [Variovorax ginsengisoli]MDN8613702.1 IS110 family transposase [Variovorax ginsengisoli]MDO1532872.1 IS110 family transposase [Variovorax ginsengisoli]